MPGPLDGVRVLDLSAVVSGPLTAALLADQGAEVIKVERPGGGDIQRNVGSRRHGFSGSFHLLNRGKRSISLDLSDPDGVNIVHKLAASADVSLQNFRPGVADRLGVGYKDLARVNPAIIYLSISGFGQTGPNAGKRAYDPIIQAYSGMAGVQGRRRDGQPGGVPTQVNQLLMDKLTAWTGFQAITAALFHRERAAARTGARQQGQHIELSMLDTAIAFLWPDAGADNILQGEGIEHHLPLAAAGTLIEMEDGWGAVMVLSDQEFQGMCTALDLPELAADERFNQLASRIKNRAAYLEEGVRLIAAAAGKLTTAEVEARLVAEQVPFARIRSLEDLPDDAQTQANKLFFERDHPVAGRMRETRPAAIFSGTPATGGGFAPTAGQHSREILAEIGLADEADDLFDRGVVE